MAPQWDHFASLHLCGFAHLPSTSPMVMGIFAYPQPQQATFCLPTSSVLSSVLIIIIIQSPGHLPEYYLICQCLSSFPDSIPNPSRTVSDIASVPGTTCDQDWDSHRPLLNKQRNFKFQRCLRANSF